MCELRVSGLLERFENENAHELRELVQLLHGILGAAKKTGAPMIVTCDGKGKSLNFLSAEETGQVIPEMPQNLKMRS